MASHGSERLTLADIARLAGVGLGTASRALNDAPNVAPATRQRVLEVAREYSYVVSPDASRLAGRSTGRVAVVVPHLARWFFGAMIEGVLSVFREAELDALLYHVGSLEDRRNFFERLPAQRKVDAIVVVAFPVEEAEQQRLEQLLEVPIVAAGGQHAVYPHVCIDDEAAGRQAVDHLIGLGHRRIGMIAAVDPEQPTQPEGRRRAYYSGLEAADITVDQSLIVNTGWGGVNGAEAMARLLALPELPTAVYAHSDEVAFGAMRSIQRAGLSIPKDISLVGIDDHPLAELVQLTTIRQPVREQGELAARMLLAILRQDPQATTSLTVPTELVVRGSTSPPHG